MEELTLATPSLLFSAVSLIMLAYTNRFLSYAAVVRALKSDYDRAPSPVAVAQIHNLRRRLYLLRAMQVLGILSLLSSVVSMLFVYMGWQVVAVFIFGISLLLLIASLCLSIVEIMISVRALSIHLGEVEQKGQ